MYHTINAASNALDNSSVFEMFDFDEIHYDNVVGYMWMNNKTPLEAARYFGVFVEVDGDVVEHFIGKDAADRCHALAMKWHAETLTATRKDDNWNDGATTIWFEDVSTNDGEIYGVVFEGCNDPMLVDVNGESVDNPAILGSILDVARAAVVDL